MRSSESSRLLSSLAAGARAVVAVHLVLAEHLRERRLSKLEQLRAVGEQSAALVLKAGGEDRRVKAAPGKLAVHHQLTQRGLPVAAEADDRAGEILPGAPVLPEAELLPGRAERDQRPGGEGGGVEDIDVAEAPAPLRYLEHRGDDVLRAGERHLGLLRRNARLFQQLAQAEREKEILVGVLVQGVDRDAAPGQAQPAQGGGPGLHGGAPGQHRHPQVVQLAHDGAVGRLGDKDHGAAPGLQAFPAQSDAVLIDAVDQRQIAPEGEQEPQMPQGLGAEGEHRGARDGIEGHQVEQPEQDQPRRGGEQPGRGDGGQLVHADKHADHRHRRADHAEEQIPRRLREAAAVEDKTADDRREHADRRKPRGKGGLEREIQHHGQQQRRR